MEKRYHGSCHCGRVAFEADIDLAQGTGRCNCSYCAKTRNWSAIIRPGKLRLLKGEDALSGYSFGEAMVYRFCSHCGVRVFADGDVPELGGKFVSVPVKVLDDATPEEVIAAPLRWSDGLGNNWQNPPAEIRHL